MSPALSGYVYFDPNFRFSDGTVGKKLFVVLGDSKLAKDHVLVVRTTSKEKSARALGCYVDQHPACFYLPCNETDFSEDTWIMLDDVTEYDSNVLSHWKRTLILSLEHTKALIVCASRSEFLPRWVQENLREISTELS